MMKRVAIVGAGNVAWSLAQAVDSLESYRVVQVMSRDRNHAEQLAALLTDASAADNTADLVTDADIYIISVSDNAFSSLIPLLPANQALWLHTSGSVPASALRRLSPSYGVLYPLQTFTKGRSLGFKEIPIFIEASSPDAHVALSNLANALSGIVKEADSDIRRRMHIAAVFGCNFTNHLWTIADNILKRDGMDISVLKPLMQETMRKAFEISPEAGQTGPARRNDTHVIDTHTGALDPQTGSLYKTLTDSIIKYYNNEQN